jgi:hypothetical protein
MINKILLSLVLIFFGNIQSQFYANFGSNKFKETCSIHLKKLNLNKDVICSLSSWKTNQDPICQRFSEENIQITFRKDVIQNCSDEELAFLVLSSSIAIQKLEQKKWKLYLEIFAIIGAPIAIGSLITTTGAYALFNQKNCSAENIFKSSIGMFCSAMFGSAGTIAVTTANINQETKEGYEKSFGQKMLYDVLAPAIGTAIGTFASIPLFVKYYTYLLSKGDTQAAEIIGYKIALNALKKVEQLPRRYDDLFDQYCSSQAQNYKARYNSLLKAQK